MEICCIADSDSFLGFKLAGVQTFKVVSRTEAVAALKVVRAVKDVAIILVTDKAAAMIPGEIQSHIEENLLPLILEIPSRGAVRKHKSAAELLKKLVGIGV
jgi:V/A-type H+-transporting ATPase subunit F